VTDRNPVAAAAEQTVGPNGSGASRPELQTAGLLPPLVSSIPTVRSGGSAVNLEPAELAIVIPMYNEAKRLELTIRTLQSSPLNRSDIQLLFADDGSTDGSSEHLLHLADTWHFGRPLQVLVDPVNRGKGSAVRRGVIAALDERAAHIAYLDADLSLDPAVVDQALRLLAEQQADVVAGERIVDPKHQPVLRRLFSLAFRSLASAIAPTGVRDTQCACKVFTAAAADAVFRPLQTDGFAFDVELMVRARRLGLNVVQFPLAWQHVSGSRVNPVTDALRMLREVWLVRRKVDRQQVDRQG
jgi:dolichyl-phosphate beta-glucosyltransferase